MSDPPHPAPAEGGTGSIGLPMDVRVVARKRGPSGDLTAKTHIGTVATRLWPVPRSHPHKWGPCSTLHRPPQRDATRRISACYCAPSRSHPVNGSLLHAPAHLPLVEGGGNPSLLHPSPFTPLSGAHSQLPLRGQTAHRAWRRK